MGNCCQPNLKQERKTNKLNSLNILAKNHIIQEIKTLVTTKIIDTKITKNSKITPEQISSGISICISNHAPSKEKAEKIEEIPQEYIKKLIEPCVDLPPFEFKHSKKNVINKEKVVLGPYKFEKGEIYIGQFNLGQREGKGAQIWPDGSYYEGYFKADNTHGYGRLVHSNKDVYEGEWESGHACGSGIFYRENGGVFQGEWENDTQNGEGNEKWPDGVEYKGFYTKGLKNGKGEFIWETGDRYIGEFINDNIEGYGEYFWNDGRIYKGYWKKNKMNGKGEFVSRDKKRFVGSFINDKKHGKGYYVFIDGREKHGEWKRGKLLVNDRDGFSDEDFGDSIDMDSLREKNNVHSNSFMLNDNKQDF